MLNPKWVVGKRIVAVETNPFDDGRGGIAHDPVIKLEGGACLSFVTVETEVGEYGTDIIYTKPPKDNRNA